MKAFRTVAAIALALSFLECAGCAYPGPRQTTSSAPPSAPSGESGADCAPQAPVPAQKTGPEKGPALARMSYATGCLHAYQVVCSRLSNDEERDRCREEGISSCEQRGKNFGDWIATGLKKPE